MSPSSQHDEFTIDGRRILQVINIGSELVQEVENTLGSFWVCTCGINHCAHIKQVIKPIPRKEHLATALLLRAKRKLARIQWLSRFTTKPINHTKE